MNTLNVHIQVRTKVDSYKNPITTAIVRPPKASLRPIVSTLLAVYTPEFPPEGKVGNIKAPIPQIKIRRPNRPSTNSITSLALSYYIPLYSPMLQPEVVNVDGAIFQ